MNASTTSDYFTTAAPAISGTSSTRRAGGYVRGFLRALAERWIWLGPAMILAVGAFDLACTIMAFEKGWLVEMNPLANEALVWGGSAGLALYRFVMTAGGCLLLVWGLRMYRLRRYVGASAIRVRTIVWGGQVVLVAAHGALVLYWIAWLNV